MRARRKFASEGGDNIIILSDRQSASPRSRSRPLLATSAVHHHLIRKGLRTSVGLVIETGEAREVHHFAPLAGYGAEAINPYLAFETLSRHACRRVAEEKSSKTNYIKAIDKGLLKVMSKMGISTYQSYCGAQIFDAVGLSSRTLSTAIFTGTSTQVEGVGLAEIATETVARHRMACSDAPIYRHSLDVGGDYAFRFRGESHVWQPEVGRSATRRAWQHSRKVPGICQAGQ